MKQSIRPFVDFGRHFYFIDMNYSKNFSLENLFYINENGLVCCEIWKDILGYEGVYQISDLGRVKSLERKRSLNTGTIKEKILKLTVGQNKGMRVTLYLNTKPKMKEVHQLVSIAFLGHKPCGYKLVINHKDFIRLNNCVSNLEIITQRENTNKKHLKSSSKFVGVYFNKSKGKWRSQIRINGIQKHLGIFDTELEASDAYQKQLILIK